MLKINNTHRIYIAFFLLCLVVVGGSVLYLSDVARKSDTTVARLYPASNTGVGGVTIDNVVLAKNLVENRVFSRSLEAPFEPDVWRTPGYPIFVAIFYSLFGNFYSVLLGHLLLLFLTVILIFKIAKKLFGQKWAILLSVIYILLPDTILSASALFNENLFVFIFVTFIYVFFFKEFKSIYVKWALTGFLLALSVYVRPASLYILLFFIPGIFIFYFNKSEINKKHLYAAILLVVVFLSTLAPWVIRNKNEVGVFSFASTGPFVLFRQNAAQFYASLTGMDNVSARKTLLKMANIPEGKNSLVPQDLKYSDQLKDISFKVIMMDPFKYVVFHLSSFIPFFTSSGINAYIGFVEDMMPEFYRAPEPSLIQALNPFSWPVLVIVIKNHGWTLLENIFWGVIAIFAFLSLFKSKDVRLYRLFMVLILYFAVVTGPIAHARYRIPVEPLLLLNAFGAITVIYDSYKKR